jgi:DNA-binding PadR family transcriptional regulator
VARVRGDELLLGEWACLGLVAATPRHGFALARELRPEGPIGRIWSLSRPLVYRAVEQLLARGLVREAGVEPGLAGGPRTVLAATPAGRRAVRAWLRTPVQHLRDVRSELLLKLALADLLKVDRAPLVVAQRATFAPLFAAMAAEPVPDDPVARWRHEHARAVERFLDGLAAAT